MNEFIFIVILSVLFSFIGAFVLTAFSVTTFWIGFTMCILACVGICVCPCMFD